MAVLCAAFLVPAVQARKSKSIVDQAVVHQLVTVPAAGTVEVAFSPAKVYLKHFRHNYAQATAYVEAY